MTPNEHDYMERYIYQVIRRLPKAQREEVRMELEELIGDMYEDNGSMEDVLTQIGDPVEFAKQYQTDQQYMIGPEYYETYLWFVRVVIICTAIPIFAVSLISTLGEASVITSQNSAAILIRAIVEGITAGVTDLLVACCSAFGAVTLTFAIIERQKIRIDTKKSEKWTVKNLSQNKEKSKSRWVPDFLEPVPNKKAMISRGDSIVGIIFMVIFCVLLIFAPHFFSAIITFNGSITTVPIFNLDQWEIILPIYVLCMLVALADEIIRLITGCYCKMVMISNIACGTIQIVLSIIVLKFLPLWNPNFSAAIQTALGPETNLQTKYLVYWNEDMVSNGLLLIIILITLAEISVTVYKTQRYGVQLKERIAQ